MLMVISPAKTLDYQTPPAVDQYSQPDLLDHSAELIDVLRQKSPLDISKLMDISDALANLNVGRYADWQRPFTQNNAKQAVYAFMGDVYEGLDASTLGRPAIGYLQERLRILSGLYGVLRPLDLMQAYRLEMGTRLANGRGKNLYEFWGETVTAKLNEQLEALGQRTLVNLASDEYFKSVKRKALNAAIVTPVFQDRKNGQYKIISFYAKRARGLMARWAAERGVADPDQLRGFDSEGYAFDASASDELTWVFRRDRE
ncbi:peroxide stress protein YaaA [Chromobacterium violaceum]|uniref:peroxide stress protein YaaA n=1 Tax=Chromobacterium violaceum TaxID=536 RepID=UPI0009DB2287|nr:peroxide stress protein YaaA [Chromobacterium violaceum]OQS09496.1 peroxide stress protein YaaA [Chromobacterium violaceum]OQS25120.1 peroxide stress protein YaaA [Chromobacterium violaceum]